MSFTWRSTGRSCVAQRIRCEHGGRYCGCNSGRWSRSRR
ncbi:MAG: hypothetical protein KDA58_14290 [Planctomycetaceae bacterium]|nr:hypothetical protein [Planctomycetaceae bacterium]